MRDQMKQNVMVFLFLSTSIFSQAFADDALKLKLDQSLKRTPVETGAEGLLVRDSLAKRHGLQLSECLNFRLLVSDPQQGLFDLCAREDRSGDPLAAEVLWELYGIAKGLGRPEPAQCEMIKGRLEKAAALGHTAAQIYLAYFTFNGGHCFEQNIAEGQRLIQLLREKALSFHEWTSPEDVFAYRLLDGELKGPELTEKLAGFVNQAVRFGHVRTVLSLLDLRDRGMNTALEPGLSLEYALVRAADLGCTICQMKALSMDAESKLTLSDLQRRQYRTQVEVKRREARAKNYGIPMTQGSVPSKH